MRSAASRDGSGGLATDRADVVEALLAWFDVHQRPLPWRATRDPYAILVSEVMLQQTQVERVLPYYERFLERFPDLETLAAASPAEVIRIWAGLGYNRRAVNLQRAARVIVERFDGEVPRDVATLRTLPGIGPYTAGAIACFAFEQPVAFLDTNMRRVVERVFVGPDERSSSVALMAIAEGLVPSRDAWRWNQALMEFGARHCTARKPLCVICPIGQWCRSYGMSAAGHREVDRPGRPSTVRFEESSRFYRGRIVAALRELESGHALRLDELGPLVAEDYAPGRRPWLATLVRGLVEDGLVAVREASSLDDDEQLGAIELRLPER